MDRDWIGIHQSTNPHLIHWWCGYGSRTNSYPSVAFHSLIVHLIDPLSIWILSIWITNIVHTSSPPEKFSAFTFPLPYRTNMDSEAESSLAPSTTVNSALTRPMRTRTAVATWAHARTALGTELEYLGRNRILYYIYCPQELLYSSPVTSNFRKYLNSKHLL